MRIFAQSTIKQERTAKVRSRYLYSYYAISMSDAFQDRLNAQVSRSSALEL